VEFAKAKHSSGGLVVEFARAKHSSGGLVVNFAKAEHKGIGFIGDFVYKSKAQAADTARRHELRIWLGRKRFSSGCGEQRLPNRDLREL
jgi:hypothetical protein